MKITSCKKIWKVAGNSYVNGPPMYDFLGFAGRTCMILVQEQWIHDAENKLKKKKGWF